MKKFWDKVLAGVICGIFIVGCYSIAHFVLKAGNNTVMIFALALIWSDMTNTISKDDAKAS